MRKTSRVLLLVALTALAVAAVATTANALVTTKLQVITYQQHGHRVGHSFIQRGLLKDAVNRNRVGRFEAKFTPVGHHRTRVRAVATFGRVGSLKVKGVVGPRDNRIPIIGGTGAYNGAAGKLKTHNLRGNHTRLTFLFVQ